MYNAHSNPGSYTVICNLHKGALNKKNKNTVYTNNTYHIKMEKMSQEELKKWKKTIISNILQIMDMAMRSKKTNFVIININNIAILIILETLILKIFFHKK